MKGSGDRVDTCVYLQVSGRYEVHVRLNTVYKTARFDTLAEARAYRDCIVAQRPKREKRDRTTILGKPRTTDFSAEETLSRDDVRHQLKRAKRSKTKRDGRTFTVIHLPEVTA